jgi:hypothetical protein
MEFEGMHTGDLFLNTGATTKVERDSPPEVRVPLASIMFTRAKHWMLEGRELRYHSSPARKDNRIKVACTLLQNVLLNSRVSPNTAELERRWELRFPSLERGEPFDPHAAALIAAGGTTTDLSRYAWERSGVTVEFVHRQLTKSSIELSPGSMVIFLSPDNEAQTRLDRLRIGIVLRVRIDRDQVSVCILNCIHPCPSWLTESNSWLVDFSDGFRYMHSSSNSLTESEFRHLAEGRAIRGIEAVNICCCHRHLFLLGIYEVHTGENPSSISLLFARKSASVNSVKCVSSISHADCIRAMQPNPEYTNFTFEIDERQDSLFQVGRWFILADHWNLNLKLTAYEITASNPLQLHTVGSLTSSLNTESSVASAPQVLIGVLKDFTSRVRIDMARSSQPVLPVLLAGEVQVSAERD